MAIVLRGVGLYFGGNMKVSIGQVWQRKDGTIVELTNIREWCGGNEFELTPISGKGRKSWRRCGGIVSQLKFVAKSKKHMVV